MPSCGNPFVTLTLVSLPPPCVSLWQPPLPPSARPLKTKPRSQWICKPASDFYTPTPKTILLGGIAAPTNTVERPPGRQGFLLHACVLNVSPSLAILLRVPAIVVYPLPQSVKPSCLSKPGYPVGERGNGRAYGYLLEFKYFAPAAATPSSGLSPPLTPPP